MANTIDIIVKTHDRTADGLSSVRRNLDGIGNAAGQVGDALGSALETAAESAGKFGVQAASTAGNVAAMGVGTTAATGGLNILVGVLLAAAAAAAGALVAFVALAPALLAIGGAAGAAIGGLAGLGASFAVLKIGLGGISDAFGAYGKSAGGSAGGSKAAGSAAEASARQVQAAQRQIRDANRQVIDSERNLVDAKRDARRASEEVTRARQDEIERLEDLEMAIRGEALSEQEALLDLARAKEKAANLTTDDSALDQKGALLDVQRAQFNLDSVREKQGDLAKEKAEADRKGVEGSDQVQAALERQRSAQERVVTATEALQRAQENVTVAHQALADAQKKVAEGAPAAAGGINQFAAAMAKLSPNAQAVVRELISLQKRFHAIKMEVQDRLLAGIAESMEKLADRWLPRLGPMLGGLADKFNLVAKGIMNSLGKEDFIRNIERAVKAFGGLVTHVGNAGSYLVDAFGKIAGHSGPVLEKIGHIIEDIARRFDKWISSAEKSGKLDDFMKNAAQTLQDIYDISGQVVTIIGQLIGILFPGSETAGKSQFDSVKDGLQKVSDWLNDPENAQKVRDFFTDVGNFMKKVISEYVPAIMRLAATIGHLIDRVKYMRNQVLSAFQGLKNGAKSAMDAVNRSGDNMVNKFKSVASRLRSALSPAWNGLRDGFRTAINWVIDRWNALHLSFPTVSAFGMTFGGGSIDTPNVPHFATGGIGGGLAMVGERGRELVRLPQGSQVIPNGTTESMLAAARRGGGPVELMLRGVSPQVEHSLAAALLSTLRFAIQSQGGNVQTVLGQGR